MEVEIDGQMKLVRIESKQGSAPGNFEISASAEDLYINADGSANQIERYQELFLFLPPQLALYWNFPIFE